MAKLTHLMGLESNEGDSHHVPDPAITIELRINTAGAIFGDGSISRFLSPDDFSETGHLTYRVLRPAGNTTTCHNIIISQDGRSIGPWL